MRSKFLLASLAFLSAACTSLDSPEPRYAAHDRELATQRAADAVGKPESSGCRDLLPQLPDAGGETPGSAAAPESADALASASNPDFSGSRVQSSGIRSDRNPAYDNNRVTLNVEVNGQSKSVVIELDPTAAPNAVANFKQNVASGAYNGLLFHRAIPGYLVQTGDPLTRDAARRNDWGTGGPSYTVPFEPAGSFSAGTVGIARLGSDVNPDRANNGSQFFITLGSESQLNGEYTAIGRVVEGLDVIEAIGNTATDDNDVPLQPVTLANAALTAGGPAGEERLTYDTTTVPKIRATGGNTPGAPINPALVGPPAPGTWRSIINRIW